MLLHKAILIIDLDAMPKYTIQVSNATCASTPAQSKETSSATVKLSMASILMGTANISAHSWTANMASRGDMEAFKGDWITPNDMSRDIPQTIMRQYFEELSLQRQRERYEGSWWGCLYSSTMLEENEQQPSTQQRNLLTQLLIRRVLQLTPQTTSQAQVKDLLAF